MAAGSGEKEMGIGPLPLPSLAIGLTAVQAASSTVLVVSLASLASLRRARAEAGSACRASLKPYAEFACADQRRAAAGGLDVFFAASQASRKC